MTVEILAGGAELLPQYSKIPSTFAVSSFFRVERDQGGLGGIKLIEEKVAQPYTKDYDEEEEDRPLRWARNFDTSQWRFLLALDGDIVVGGAAVAFNTPGIYMLCGGDGQTLTDIAALWDIRVSPPHRRRGVGTRLFRRAADWARQQGCKLLKIETQNINVPACRFYGKQGCGLGGIDLYGYRGHYAVEHEVRLIWYLDLRDGPSADTAVSGPQAEHRQRI